MGKFEQTPRPFTPDQPVKIEPVPLASFDLFATPRWGLAEQATANEEQKHGDNRLTTQQGSFNILYHGEQVPGHVEIKSHDFVSEGSHLTVTITISVGTTAEYVLIRLSIQDSQKGPVAEMWSSIKKEQDKQLEIPSTIPLPKGIGLALYDRVVSQIPNIAKRFGKPVLHRIVCGAAYGSHSITTAEKWYEWFGPTIEKYGYTPEDDGIWQKTYTI